MKYDFLITYEIKNREIENICLLKRELERRGYTVKICNMYSTFFETPKPDDAEVAVVSEYYFPHEKYYVASHLNKVKKIVVLRWEQVFNNSNEENPNSTNSIKEWGRDAVHIAWGPFPAKRMTNEWKVPKENVKLTGQITLDFLRGKLINYYDDKETVFRRHNLPLDKRANLFISSLAMSEMHDKQIDDDIQDVDNFKKFMDITKRTQKELLNWFERILDENPDDIIIYRPHPVEKDTLLLKEYEKKLSRLFVIGEESVKQWILICDKIYNWISTSIAEVYSAGKGCTMLRPVSIPKENDMKIYNNTNFVTTYDDFKTVFNENNQGFNVPIENIKQYYFIDDEKYSYELICDVLEDVYKNDKYLLNKPLVNPFLSGGIFNIERIKNIIKRFVAKSRITNYIYKNGMFKKTKFKYLLDDVIITRNKIRKNSVSEEEIEAITKKIDNALS